MSDPLYKRINSPNFKHNFKKEFAKLKVNENPYLSYFSKIGDAEKFLDSVSKSIIERKVSKEHYRTFLKSSPREIAKRIHSDEILKEKYRGLYFKKCNHPNNLGMLN